MSHHFVGESFSRGLTALATVGLLAALATTPARGHAQSKSLEAIAAPVKQPLSKPEARARIETYLDSIDTPIPEASWRALGPNGVVVLDEIARDRTRLPTARAQAVGALGMLDGGSPRAVGLMLDLAKRETEPPILRNAALRVLGDVLPPDRMMTAIAPLISQARSYRVRATAAEVLARRNPAAACGPVKRQLGREPGVQRAAFTKAVEACTPATIKKPVPPPALTVP
jgi:hypothetical protein